MQITNSVLYSIIGKLCSQKSIVRPSTTEETAIERMKAPIINIVALSGWCEREVVKVFGSTSLSRKETPSSRKEAVELRSKGVTTLESWGFIKCSLFFGALTVAKLFKYIYREIARFPLAEFQVGSTHRDGRESSKALWNVRT